MWPVLILVTEGTLRTMSLTPLLPKASIPHWICEKQFFLSSEQSVLNDEVLLMGTSQDSAEHSWAFAGTWISSPKLGCLGVGGPFWANPTDGLKAAKKQVFLEVRIVSWCYCEWLAFSGLPYTLEVFSSPFLSGLSSRKLNCQLLCSSLHFSMVFRFLFWFPRPLHVLFIALILLTCRRMKDNSIPHLVLWIRFLFSFEHT